MKHFIYFLIGLLLISKGNTEETAIQPPLVKVNPTPKSTVCLNMIVKDESAVICRCLASVKPIIDYWVIVDTGSSDNTQTIIKEFMKDIPGELHERPWKNFAHNRNEALELAKGKADYLLFIDADEVLKYSKDYKLPPLSKDFYYITTEFSGTKYGRTQLVNNKLDWKWVGVLHEYLDSKQIKTSGTLTGVINFVSTDGNRSKDSQKYQKDAQLLETALIDEPDNARYRFYLAQSYRDAKDYEHAITNYQKRIEMGGWDQEVFWSMLQMAIMQQLSSKPPEVFVDSYNKAFDFRPSRAEPLYRLANYYREAGEFEKGYQTAKKGLHIRDSKDVLFVERWIYDYGLLLEFSVSAYWTGRFTEALLATHLLLVNTGLPKNVRDLANQNLAWIHQMLRKDAETPRQGAVAIDLAPKS